MILTPKERMVLQSFTTTAKNASISCPAGMTESDFKATVFSLEEKKLVESHTNLGKRIITLTDHGKDLLQSGMKQEWLTIVKDWAPIATLALLLLNIFITLLK